MISFTMSADREAKCPVAFLDVRSKMCAEHGAQRQRANDLNACAM